MCIAKNRREPLVCSAETLKDVISITLLAGCDPTNAIFPISWPQDAPRPSKDPPRTLQKAPQEHPRTTKDAIRKQSFASGFFRRNPEAKICFRSPRPTKDTSPKLQKAPQDPSRHPEDPPRLPKGPQDLPKTPPRPQEMTLPDSHAGPAECAERLEFGRSPASAWAPC